MNPTKIRLRALRQSLLGALILHRDNLGQLIHLLGAIQELEESQQAQESADALAKLCPKDPRSLERSSSDS